ncbi:MAG: hypothetical protein VW397_05095, partial [Candidatus Margulisiibacteriota bacterium]
AISTVSQSGTTIVVSGDIALSNTDKLHFLTNQRRPVMDLYKNSNQLIFQQKNTKPFLFNTQAGQTIMSVSNNRLIAINKSEPSANANLYVDGDVLFNEPVFYKNAGDQLIQAFVINQKSNDVANNKEVRSVKSLTVDETSGLGLSVSPSENKIVFHAPDYYYRIYETPLMDGFVPNGGLQYIEPVGKDIIEFKEVLPNGGVSINLVDTNSDGVKDSIRFFNPLMNGGVINGTITVNGQVYLNGSNGNGTEVTSIPFKWKLKYNDLYYSSGNVGINTKSPNYDFEVNDLMQSDRIYISNELFNQRIQLNNATSTTTNQKISFLIDSNNSNSNDQFQISTTSNALLTFTGDSIANNHRYGFFTNSPQAILHAENLSGKEGVLFQSLPSGVSGLTLTTLTNNSAYIQLNSNIDNNKLGKINEGLIATSRNILFTTNGDTNPSLYLKENSVSIGLDETKNTLFANGSMTVGADYAGITQNDASTGLTIEGKLYVGHLTTADPGSNLFVKDSLSVGRNVNKIIPQNFKGVIVSRNLGVNVAKPLDRFSINGGARLKSDILFYKDDTPIFQLLPNQFKLIEGGYGMDFYLPDLMSFHVNNTKRLSIFSNSVTFGTFADKTTNNFYLYNETGDATLFLEDTNAPPSITFESKNGSVKGKIGIMPNGASTKVLIESNGDTLSNPDITITEGKVGVGKMPAYAMDINGGVKTENLYQNNDRLYPVPQGVIVMWSGTKASIPAGWALCDGQSGRPNLTDKFIMGADLANIGK